MPVVRYYKQAHFPGRIDWSRAETGWRTWGNNEPRDIYELVGYDADQEAGESVELEREPYMAVGARWPEPTDGYGIGPLPEWLEAILKKDERELAETTPVLAPEKVLVGAV